MVSNAAMIKAVFFDLYHTLLRYDPPREEPMAKAINAFGIEVTPEALRRPLVAADEFIYQEHARLPLSKRPDEEKKALWAQYQAVVLKEAGIEPTTELVGSILSKMQQIRFNQVLFDDVLPTLNELQGKGLILGLISNIDSDIAPLFRKLGLTPLLQVVVTSQGAGYSKPQPEIFREAVRQAGVRAEEAIYVGDQYQIDVIGATEAGMQGILLDRGGFFKEATENPKIQNLYQLLEHLRRQK